MIDLDLGPGDTLPNGAPPNLRIVDCCNTCKHVEWHYEGERYCKKYVIRYEWYDADDEPTPMSVSQNDICDSHELDTPPPEPTP